MSHEPRATIERIDKDLGVHLLTLQKSVRHAEIDEGVSIDVATQQPPQPLDEDLAGASLGTLNIKPESGSRSEDRLSGTAQTKQPTSSPSTPFAAASAF
ncbi:hypothetical protein [Microbacterium sp. GXF6406]